MYIDKSTSNLNERFEYVYSQKDIYIIVDKMTGVNYLLTSTGVTPLLNADGTVITTQSEGTW